MCANALSLSQKSLHGLGLSLTTPNNSTRQDNSRVEILTIVATPKQSACPPSHALAWACASWVMSTTSTAPSVSASMPCPATISRSSTRQRCWSKSFLANTTLSSPPISWSNRFLAFLDLVCPKVCTKSMWRGWVESSFLCNAKWEIAPKVDIVLSQFLAIGENLFARNCGGSILIWTGSLATEVHKNHHAPFQPFCSASHQPWHNFSRANRMIQPAKVLPQSRTERTWIPKPTKSNQPSSSSWKRSYVSQSPSETLEWPKTSWSETSC